MNETLKPHGDTALSTAKGYGKVGSYGQLDKVLFQVIGHLEGRLNAMQHKINEQAKMIEALTTARNASGTSGGGGGGLGGNRAAVAKAAPTSYAAVVQAKPVSTAADVLELIVKERRQAASKETSVVISGLPEDTDPAVDRVNIRKVMIAADIGVRYESNEYLNDSCIRRAGKVAAADGRPRLVFVKLDDIVDGEALMEGARARFRADAAYKNVFIRRDRTRHEVFMEFELRRERNERNAKLPQGDGNARYATDRNGREWYWGVRWGELWRIDRDTRKAFKA